MARITGRYLAQHWGVDVKHALYREDGIWFHRLRAFPAALFDANGYVLFRSADEYHRALDGQIKQDVHVRGGISSLSGYVRIRLCDHDIASQRSINDTSEPTILEGKGMELTLTRYERDPLARALCLRHYGFRCCVCDILFLEVYGPLGLRFIQVHHLQPLATGGKERPVDPIKDLRPVCPNCHAMLHRREPPLTIDELRRIFESCRGDHTQP